MLNRCSIILFALQFIIPTHASNDNRLYVEINFAYTDETNKSIKEVDEAIDENYERLIGETSWKARYEVGDTVCIGETREYRVVKVDGSIYYWWVDDNLQQESSNIISIQWNEIGFHKVEVQEVASSGCYGEVASCMVQVVDCPPSSTQPTAFTPDGDGLNDIFIPILKHERGHPVTYEFRIFNKRGLILFESYSPETGWDGKYKGKLLPTDNYYYQLKIKYPGSKKSERLIGTILLINRT